MRTLIYVPIIHTSADLGSLAGDIAKRGVADLGQEVWSEHLRTIEGFWYAISLYFRYIDEWGLNIYQDGMVADGEIGQKIVEEGMRLGSKNYEIISKLLKQGAVLVKTEDFNLVKLERDKLLAITKSTSTTQKLIAFIKYKLTKNSLLNKRDKFIAQKINETLDCDKKGVLFIGAFHNVKRWLAKDIEIREIKNLQKVREYQKLLPFCHKHKERFQELGRYLSAQAEV